jgi:S-sulfosulfanyl-L-cysteine sulfohydrolase
VRRTLSILQLNDLHGYVRPHPELVRPDGTWTLTELGGLARIASVFDEVRAETGGAVLALDNGDTFHGTHLAVASRGHAMVPMMNRLGIDAMTLHWEFAYTPTGVREFASRLAYPMLAINCYERHGDGLAFAPYVIVERADLRIAVIGLACPIVDATMPAHFSEGVRFTLGRDELPGWIRTVRRDEGADLVVVLSHLGLPQDLKLACEVDGIDVLLSGHTHNRLRDPIRVNDAIVIQAGCHGAFVGRLDVEVEGKHVVAHRYALLPVDDRFPEDAEMAALVTAAVEGRSADLGQVVGVAGATLHRYAMFGSTMDDVLLEALAETAGVRVAFSNGWRYGAPIPPGPVTVEDLWSIVPTNPPVMTATLTGTELIDMLEENLERTFAADPFEQMGGYVKRMRGVRLYVKVENPRGHRIDRLFVADRPVEPDEAYEVAFITDQGVPARFGRNRRSTGVDAVSALRNLFEARGTVVPSREATIFVI